MSMDARTLILQTQLLTSCQRMGKWMGEHEYKDTNIANTVLTTYEITGKEVGVSMNAMIPTLQT